MQSDLACCSVVRFREMKNKKKQVDVVSDHFTSCAVEFKIFALFCSFSGLSGLDEMAAAAFAGAMAATYHGYIYGGYQAMYTPGVSQQPVAYAPPLPVEELPPPPPGVDDPPMPSDPPPPPPPPDDDTDDDDQPPTPGDEPPPLPPGVELQGPSADVSNSEAK